MPVLRVDGTTGRIDMLLSKARKPRASELEHLVVELKGLQKNRHVSYRPDKSYAHAVSNDPRFDKRNTKWIFIAVSNEVDSLVEDEISQDDRPYGLLYTKGNVSIDLYLGGS